MDQLLLLLQLRLHTLGLATAELLQTLLPMLTLDPLLCQAEHWALMDHLLSQVQPRHLTVMQELVNLLPALLLALILDQHLSQVDH